MNYQIEIWSIKELIKIVEKKQIDLKPPYQRNFIWKPKDQSNLIDSILKGFPLPNFFLYKKEDDFYEMVDGQQRTRTIYRFWKAIIKDSNNNTINNIDSVLFLEYKLSITIIHSLSKSDSLQYFYSLVNRTGMHLNVPELTKAQYHNSKFLQLVEDLIDYQKLIELDLFTDITQKRMNDRYFIEELIGYLKIGITDKKHVINRIYESDLTEIEAKEFKAEFKEIIEIIYRLNNIHPIKKTRYKQRNDFFTLFNFVHINKNQSFNLFKYQYSILRLMDPYITPSNEECEPLQEYALNCVSQSNSRIARENRLKFFNNILRNKEIEGNDELNEVIDFLAIKFNIETPINLISIEDTYQIDISHFKQNTNV